MKKITFLLLTILPFLGFGQLTNGTFDAGISGWAVQNSSTLTAITSASEPANVRTGTGSLKIVAAATLVSGAKTTPNASVYDGTGDYIFSAYAKGAIGDQLQLYVYQASGGTSQTFVTHTFTTTGWELVTGTKSLVGGINTNLRLISKTASATIYVDDVTFVKQLCTGYAITTDTTVGGTNEITSTVLPCYPTSEVVNFLATPCQGYVVTDWEVNGVSQSTSGNEFSLTVGTEDATVIPIFSLASTPDLNFDSGTELNQWYAPNSDTSTAIIGDDLTVTINSGATNAKITYDCAPIMPTTNNITFVKIGYTNNTTNEGFRLNTTNPAPDPEGNDFSNWPYNPLVTNGSGVALISLTDSKWTDNVTKLELQFWGLNGTNTTDPVSGDIIIHYIEFISPSVKNTYDFSSDDTTSFTGNSDCTVTDGGTTLNFNANQTSVAPGFTQFNNSVDATNLSLYLLIDSNASNANYVQFSFRDPVSKDFKFYGWNAITSGTTVITSDLFSIEDWTGEITEWQIRFSVNDDGTGDVDTGTISISKILFFNNNVTIADGIWNDNATWQYGKPSDSQTAFVIHEVTVDNNAFINNLIVEAPSILFPSYDGKVIIEAGKSLSVSTNVTLTADNLIELNSNSTSYSSLIIGGAISNQDVIYNRYVNEIGTTNASNNGNDLISAPVTNASQTFAAFVTNPSNADLSASGDLRAIAPFDNTITMVNSTTVQGAYVNYDIVSDNLSTIDAGIGYRVATDTGSPLTFTGNVITGTKDVAIAIGAGSKWNLIGNPYPSYIDFETFFNATNKAQLDGSFQAIYGYNGTDWTIWNQAVIDDGVIIELITPGQGFFVRSVSGGGTLSFTPAMRTIGASDDFISGRTTNVDVALAKLQLAKGSDVFNTDIYFNSNATTNLDPGYDAGAYQGNAAGIFTELVEGNTGVELAIQALAYTDFNDVVVPLGVKANAGEQITISLDGSTTTIPSNINVYLEDTVNNSFTLLNTSDYVNTLGSTIDGTGRYFLRFTSSTLSNSDFDSSSLHIYVNQDRKSLEVKGMLQDTTDITVFDIQGRLVLNTQLESNSSDNTIDVSSINTGIYIVYLNNSKQQKAQKVIIN